MKSKCLIILILFYKISHCNAVEFKNKLLADFSVISGLQWTQNYSLTSKQVFSSYFSRKVGFQTKYFHAGVTFQEFFSPINLDGYSFNQRVLAQGVFCGINYIVNHKLETSINYQRSKLKFVHPYTQYDNVDSWFSTADYRAGYDLNNEINLFASYKIMNCLWVNANATYGFNSKTFGGNYVGYGFGLQASLPINKYSSHEIDSVSFRKKRKMYGFIGTTRILKDYRKYEHHLLLNDFKNEERPLREAAFNYDLFRPVAMVCAGVITKGKNLFYINLGKHETFTKDKLYNVDEFVSAVPDESYLYHSQSKYIGLSADINPFSFFKKTSKMNLFPIISFFGHYKVLEQQSIRNLMTDFNNSGYYPYFYYSESNIKSKVLYYGSALGVGVQFGRLYGNVKFDVVKWNYIDYKAKRKTYNQGYYSFDGNVKFATIINEISDLNIKGSVAMNKEIGGTGIRSKILQQSAFTIGILF